jgi:hypothetical protein
MFVSYLSIKFRMPCSSLSLVITMKPETKYVSREPIMAVLHYTLNGRKNTIRRSIATRNLRILHCHFHLGRSHNHHAGITDIRKLKAEAGKRLVQ